MNIPQRARELAELLAVYPGGDKFNLILAFAVEVERDALERAARACADEYLNDRTGKPIDIAYNRAITECVSAIRTLIAPSPTPERPDPTVALARLFRLLWEWSHLSPIDHMVDVNLAQVGKGPGQWKLTALGIEAVRIAKETECG